jgi:hypothetical protein
MKTRLISVIYGDKYLPMLWVHLQSTRLFSADIPVSIFFNDVSNHEIDLLKTSFPKVTLLKSTQSIEEQDMRKKIPLKLRLWSQACEKYPDNILYLIDCDTVLCSDLTGFIKEDYDILYTWKNEFFPLNTGFMIVKSNNKVREFMRLWLKMTEETIENPVEFEEGIKINGGISQHTFAKIINTQSYDGITERNINGKAIRFKGVECKYLNETNCVPITQDTHIIHYKGGWHPILLENKPFSKNRPEDTCKEMFEYWGKIYRKVTKTSMQKFVLESCKENEKEFIKNLKRSNKRSIFSHDMFVLYSVTQKLNIDIIIEAGESRMQKTEFLADYFCSTPVKIISIRDKEENDSNHSNKKTKKASNVKLIYGNVNQLIPNLLRQNCGKKVAILFNGAAKGKKINLFQKTISSFPEVIVGFFYNAEELPKEKDNLTPKVIENSFERIFVTNDEKYISSLKHLNKFRLPKHDVLKENKEVSYYPPLAVVLPVFRERLKKTKKDKSSKGTYKFVHLPKCIKLFLKKILGKEKYYLTSKKIKRFIGFFLYKGLKKGE